MNLKTIKKINATKNYLFEKINKINKHLARLTTPRKKRHRSQISEM